MAIQMLLNAEVDKHEWSYTLLHKGQFVYRYKKKMVRFAKTPNCDLVQAINMYERVGYKWVKLTHMWRWIWLSGIDGPVSIKDAMERPWGKEIVPKSLNLFRIILTRTYILRYIRHLKHITWMPGSKAFKMIEKNFYENNKKE